MDKAEKVFNRISFTIDTNLLEKQAGPMWEAVKKFTKNIFSKGKVELGKSKNYIQSSIRGESPAIARTPLADSISKSYSGNRKFTQMQYSSVAPVKNPPVVVFNAEQKAQELAKAKHLRNLGL